MSKLDPLYGGRASTRTQLSNNSGALRKAPSALLSGVVALGLCSSAIGQGSSGDGMEVFENFTAVGQGESRATNSLTFSDLEFKVPGQSLEKSLDAIPGVNVTSTDPFGFYEFGNSIRIRSFDISRLAVTVDDVPMSNNSPRYGTPVGRVSDPENMGQIKVSQGTGDVTTAAAEALGGSIMYTTRAPSSEAGALVKWSVGSFDNERVFARYDTGEIFPGFTSYLSVSRFRFKAAGLPDFSESNRIEFKGVKELEKGSLTIGYTWNDRDDFDTRNIQWDRWRALETGSTNGSTNSDISKFAAGGYRDYTNFDAPSDRLSGFLLGDYTDRGRNLGAIDYLDPKVNLGDDPNSRYYLRWRNGRMDHFLRARLELDLNDDVKWLSTYYGQDKKNYGLFPVSRGDSRTQIQNAYLNTNDDAAVLGVQARSNATTGWTDRPDIWPQYLFRNAQGALVSINTPGAIPVGYNDLNGDGFYSTGDTLNLTATPSAFTGSHALAVRGSTAPALNGATARDEDFTADRFGTTQRFDWTIGEHKLRAGFWYEQDTYYANRPTYMLEGDSPTGGFLYDRVLFLNYLQNFKSRSFIGYIDDQFSLMECDLRVNVGAKIMNIKREAWGQLTTPTWWRNATATREGTFKDNFLPQIGATYTINDKFEAFGSYAENLAAPDYGVVASDTFTTALLPERSENFDLGLRYSAGAFNATVATFLNKYEDRILSVALTQEELAAAGLSGVTGVTNFRNVGAIEATGLEMAFEWRAPIENLSFAGSVAYQKSEFQDNLIISYASSHNNSPYYRRIGTTNFSEELIAGKSQGNTPDITTSIDARYKIGNLRMSVGGKYFDSVYVNVHNTEEIPSYTIFNASASSAFPEGHSLDGFSATVTVDNLFDSYIWYAGGSNGSFNGTVRADYGRSINFTIQNEF